MATKTKTRSVRPAGEGAAPRHRSGAVARMVRMPVATLRIWERRSGVTSPATTAAGHRLYSAADVQRVALLRQLTEVGHAIGSIGALPMSQLRRVAATHASTLAKATPRPRRQTAAPTRAPMPMLLAEVAPRRYDDATLADFAGLSSTIACECPQHVAALLMQLTHFEAYSAECRRRNRADAALHAYLQQVAAASRALFEAALEQLAIHEGLVLPG